MGTSPIGLWEFTPRIGSACKDDAGGNAGGSRVARKSQPHILVKLRNPNEEIQVANRINSTLPGNKVQLDSRHIRDSEKTIPYLGVFLRILVGLAAIVSAVVVMLAMYTTITERTREIGILKAMGASRRYIVFIIESEALVISVVGLVAGFVFSFAIGYAIHQVYGLFFEYSWSWGLTAAAIGILGGAIGALYPPGGRQTSMP